MRFFLIFLSLIYVVGASYAQRFKTALAAPCDPHEKILAFDPAAERGLKEQLTPEPAVMLAAGQNQQQEDRNQVFGSDRRCRG